MLINYNVSIIDYLYIERFITKKTFLFANQTVLEMLQAIKHVSDSKEFNFDCCSIVWDDYIELCVVGTQKYILKCDDSKLPSAKRTLKRFTLSKL